MGCTIPHHPNFEYPYLCCRNWCCSMEEMELVRENRKHKSTQKNVERRGVAFVILSLQTTTSKHHFDSKSNP